MGTNDELKEQIKLNKELLKDLNRQTGFYNEIKGASRETRRAIEEQLKATQALIDELENIPAGTMTNEQKESLKLLKEQREQQKDLNREYRKTFTIAGRITGEFATQRQLSLEFVQTQAAIFNYSEKIAHEYRDIARDIGLTRDQAHGVGVAFRAALPEVLAMGGEMTDITNLYTSFSQQSGRLRFFNEEDIITMDALSRATKMMPSEVAGIAETFDLMGVGVE